VVIHDDLLTEDLLDACRGAERIYVGKRAGRVHTPQEEICSVLVTQANLGRRVVRLKGGDPMIFGRATEEIRALRAAGIPFEVVPGVTSAAAAASQAGFSLTERHVASAVVFVTGHECAGKASPAVRWDELARTGATLCLYMGVGASSRIAEQLIGAGMAPATPVAAAASVSHAGESFRLGVLTDLQSGELLRELPTPVVLIIGSVAREASLAAGIAGGLLAA
jgi:uroporphyrin-III C-methyltransferase